VSPRLDIGGGAKGGARVRSPRRTDVPGGRWVRLAASRFHCRARAQARGAQGHGCGAGAQEEAAWAGERRGVRCWTGAWE